MEDLKQYIPALKQGTAQVATDEIQDDAISTAKIADDAITTAKISGGKIIALKESFVLADFADVTTTGTAEFATDLPIGAVVTQTLITGVEGFVGDTSATVTIGDGSDPDRYNTGTPSVFTTVANLSAGAVSGTAFQTAAKTPTIIVTTNADFTSVTAGAMTVTIFYYIAA